MSTRGSRLHFGMFVAFALAAGALSIASCATNRSEGLDASKMPEAVRPDYEVFAQRCSKCHSLARPLQSGIDDDAFWALYVARMRRQPSSGISMEDTTVILRFLHYFSEERKRAKTSGNAPEPPPGAVTATPTAMPTATPTAPTAPLDAGEAGR